MLPPTQERVARHTSNSVNERIRRQTEQNISRCLGPSSLASIDRRLYELDREWDIERAIETNAAVLGLAGLGLGAFVDKRFLIIPAIVCGFLLEHALQGWCPPVSVFRRFGVRTGREIENERNALKALRGDYRDLANGAVADGPAVGMRALRAASY
jgi:hypothetical protein